MFGWSLIRVIGRSMMPVLPAGSFALFRKRSNYRDGDILLVDHPRFGAIVKRATHVGQSRLWLEGANSQSISRETLGPVDAKCVKGCLVWQSKSP